MSEWATRAFFLYGGQRIAGIGPSIDAHCTFPSINPGRYVYNVLYKIKIHTIFDFIEK